MGQRSKMSKRAAITGINGQDGFYLSKYLLSLGYEVYGLRRPSANDEKIIDPRIKIYDGDLLDGTSLEKFVRESRPHELYNLAGFSHIGKSFGQPETVVDINALGVVRLLEIIKNHSPETRFCQASSYEIFAGNEIMPANELSTPMPVSPYSISKLAADNFIKLYRANFGLFACSAILGNHESPYRPKYFVTRKITNWLAKRLAGDSAPLSLGFLDAARDWGSAEDYVVAMHQILSGNRPQDYIVCTGVPTTVRQFLELSLKLYDIPIRWSGGGAAERGYDINNNELIIIDPLFYRPTDVPLLYGDNAKICEDFGWYPKIKLENIIEGMVKHDLLLSQTHQQRKGW